MFFQICPECVSEGFSFMSGGVGAELCSPRVASTVRKTSASARKRSL